MIRAVIVDWGGVLIDDIAPFIIEYVANHLGVSCEEFTVQMRQCVYLDFGKGCISEDIFWDNACKTMGIEKPRVHSLWGDAFKAGYSEKKDVFGLIDCLKDRGYKIGLLSNTEIPATEFFYQRGYTQFDTVVFSCKERVCKPDKEIYEIMLRRLDVRSHEAVFVDDKEENVHGAQDVGLHGIIFVSPEQVKKELEILLEKENG